MARFRSRELLYVILKPLSHFRANGLVDTGIIIAIVVIIILDRDGVAMKAICVEEVLQRQLVFCSHGRFRAQEQLLGNRGEVVLPRIVKSIPTKRLSLIENQLACAREMAACPWSHSTMMTREASFLL